MKNNVINREEAFSNLISEEHYFLSLLQVLNANDLLNKKDMEKIQIQIIELLREIVVYYTRDESSSVRVEVAEQIMLSIYYTIGAFLKNTMTIKESINLIIEKDLKDLFRQGEELLIEKVDACKRKLKGIQKNRLETSNYAYIDTIDYGIDLFFKEYDIRFASHDSPGSIDYPLAIDEMKLVGVEYLEAYLNTLELENKLCSYFDISEIEDLLKSYNKNSHHMLINIYKFVLTNYLGVILLGKGGKSLNITEEERVHLKSIVDGLSEEELKRLFLMALGKLFKELSIEDEGLKDYINKTILKLIPEIKYNIETNTLDKAFITIKTQEEKPIIYKDGESLDNGKFKRITEEIRNCSKVEDKIKIIREELHSLKDLADVLSSYCIFDEEFIYIFKDLEDFEIALLTKYLPDTETGDSDYGTECEREWHERLVEYIDNLEELRKGVIIQMSQEIQI